MQHYLVIEGMVHPVIAFKAIFQSPLDLHPSLVGEGLRVGVVVDDPAVDDPLDVGHGRPHDLAGQRGVHVLGPEDPPREGDGDVGLAGELGGGDVVPLLLVEPRGLVARRRAVVQPLLDHVVPEVLQPAIFILDKN